MNASSNLEIPFPCKPLNVFYDSSFNSANHDSFITALTIVNGIIAVAAGVSNAIIIITFFKTTSLRTPSNFLILSLSFSDLAVGVVAQPLYCVFRYSQTKWDTNVMCFSFKAFSATVWFLGLVSFLTLTVVTMDRFLALKLHLRYKELVTTTRYCGVFVFILIVSAIASCCRMVGFKLLELAMALTLLMLALFIIAMYFMLQISRAIRRHSAQIHAQEQSAQQNINMPRYKKSVNTMYYVIGAFVLCYIPFIVCLVVSVISYRTLKMLYVSIATETLLMCNGLLNPIIYCWRVRGIRHAIRHVLNSSNIFSRQPPSLH